MSLVLPTVLHIARHVLENDKAWLLFLEIPSRSQPGKGFRLVAAKKVVTANGQRWQPATMKITLPAASMDGDVGTLSAEIPNVLRVAASWVEAQDDVVGQTATVWLQHESVFTTGFIRQLSWAQRIISCDITETSAKLIAGKRPGARRIPMGVYDRRSFPQLTGAGQAL